MAEMTRGGSTWLFVGIRAVLMLLFGLYAVIFPALALAALVLVGGALLFVDGILGLWSHTFGNAKTGNYWFDVVRSALAIIAGAIILISPLLATIFTVTFLVYMVAFQSIIVGGMEIYQYFQRRSSMAHGWPVLLSGIVYVLFGIMLLFWPLESAIALTVVGGILMIIFSFGLFGLAARLRKAGI
jgi:uncharacterized membrane protein HdeD (DUF308 family)